MASLLAYISIFCKTKALKSSCVISKRYLVIRVLRPQNSSKFSNIIKIANRSFSRSIDYNNPSTQLIEENQALNYKLYYQFGLPTAADRQEFDEFNDPIWYGRIGHEMVYRIKDISHESKNIDLFLMRDYHNNKIIGLNGMKRVSSTTDVIFNTDKYGKNKSFNYTIRRYTAISPELQGKGYGKIIRKYSRELDDLHVGNRGVSITEIQRQNIASLNLQLKSGFEITTNSNVYQVYRSKFDIPSAITAKYDMYKIDIPNLSNDEWKIINGLHHRMIKKYNIIDLSVTPNAIYSDPLFPVYIIKSRNSNSVLAAIQVMTGRGEMKAPNIAIKYAMDIGSKLLPGMPPTEHDTYALLISPLYIDYGNEECDIAQVVSSLITYIFKDRNVHFGVTTCDTKSPWSQFLDRKNKRIVCGTAGSMMSEMNTSNALIKFTGLDDEQVNVIKNNPVQVKLPVPMFL